jgi:hypothetical protein
MWLTVMQTSVPAPRKTTDGSARARQQIKSQSDGAQKQTTPPSTILHPNASPSTKSDSKTETPKDAQQSVRITDLPTVSVKDNGIDWRLWVSNALLVIVSGLQIWLLFGTLKATEKAANAAKTSANTARGALYLTQAADIHIDSIPVNPRGVLTKDTIITIILKNFGQTRANKITQDLTFGIPGNPVALENKIGMDLGAGQKFTMTFPCTEALLKQAQAQGVSLKLWGTIKYYDVFRKAHRITCEGSYPLKGGNWTINHYEVADEAGPESESRN